MLTVCVTLVATAFACANPNAPPGGPVDKEAPVILKITPANGTIGAKPKVVAFQFDEVISESPKSANDLSKLVFISPKSGDPQVEWRRSQLDVKPKKGWRPNTVYTVTLGAGVMDLRGNSIDSATRIVFSTGGPIPDTKLTGVAFDWQVGRPAAKAIVEAIARDTFQTIADSIGRFSLEHLPSASYLVRAFVDRNVNRLLEATEPWDTVTTTVTSTATAELYAYSHDTIGLRIADVQVLDSGKTLRVTFDKPVLPGQAFTSSQFVVQRADSTQLSVETVFSAPMRFTFDSLKRKAREDSVLKAQPPLDTSLAARTKRDSVARIKTRDSLALVERQRLDERRLAVLRGDKPLPPRDTTPPPKMKRPALFTDMFVTFDKPLDPNTAYRITARSVRSISGTQKSPSRAFKTPPKETPKDTTKKTPPPTGRQ